MEFDSRTVIVASLASASLVGLKSIAVARLQVATCVIESVGA